MDKGLKKSKISCIAAAALLCTNYLNAEETVQLTPVSIEEKKVEEFDLQSAKQSQPENLSEVLKHDTKIDMAGGSPNAKRFYIRGISEALTNITVDGAKQGKDLHQHRGGLNNIDTEILKSVKVDAGVAAADNGPGNLGGSVSLETVDAQELLKDGETAGAFIKTTQGSVADSYKNTLGVYGKADKVGFLIYGSKADSDDYETGSGRTVYGSSEEVEDYMVKISALGVLDHDIRISHEKNTQEGLYQSGGPGSDMGYHDPSGARTLERQQVERETTVLNHKYNPSSSYINTGFKVYKNDTKLSYLERDSSEDIKSRGKGLDIRNIFSFGSENIKNDLTVGFDYENEEGSSSGGEIEYENRGLFIQNRMQVQRLKLSFGARLDDFESDLIYKNSSDKELSANISTEYFLSDHLSLFAGYGEAVSGSNTIPVGWLTNLDPNLTFNGSSTASLNPQKAKKYEIGTNFEKDDFFTDADRFALNVTLFDTKIEDPVVVGTGGRMGAPVSDIINDDDIQSRGFEISTGYDLEKLRTALSYSHVKVEQNGQEITGTTKREAGSYGDKVSANLNYDLNANVKFGYTFTHVFENENAAGDVNNKSGYTLHDIYASYVPEGMKNIALSLAVNNLFDKNYVAQTSLTSNGEAVAEAGRDIRVSLKYTF